MAKKSWHDDPWIYAIIIIAASVTAGITTAVVTKQLNLQVADLKARLAAAECPTCQLPQS
jgi:hypothetical protein